MPTDDGSLVAVLEHYGASFVPEGGQRSMRCPFHDDRQASATVNTDEGLFFCFTCGVKGDAIAIVRDREGLGFVEARRYVEGLAGGSGREVRGRARREGSALPPGQGGQYRNRPTLPRWRVRYSRDWS